MKGVKRGQVEDSAQRLATPCTNCTALPVFSGPGPPFKFTGKMSDGAEEELRPPRTPEHWEALTDEEDRVEENTGIDDSDLEGAEQIRFRRLIAWQQIARWTKSGKSEEDVQALIQAATDQVKPWIPFYRTLHNQTAQKYDYT